MKNAMAWIAAAVLVLSATVQTNAQTTNVDFFTLNLNIGLTAMTNNAPVTNDNTVTVDSGQIKITSASIIQLLSGRRSFPLGTIVDGNSNAIPHLGAAVMTNFSKSARLLVLQALGTNHGSTFVVVRDGNRHPVDYDVSEYFDFSPRGFSPVEGDHVDTRAKLDLDTGEQTTTRVYINDFSFDDTPGMPHASDRVAFTVDGLTTDQRTSVSSHGDLIDTDATRSLNANVAGTGVVSNNFAVLKGFINANGARHETK
jgi:hypothetical protein